MTHKYTVRWGILATGGIAKTFANDLSVDPLTRGVHNIAHTVVAASSSTCVSRAESFLKEINASPAAKAYDSYEALINDPEVDIIYIASPHSLHFQHAMACILGGKSVLCEKPVTVNAEQAALLVKTARDKSLFLMEAMWTRYLPISQEIELLVRDGKIGKVHRVLADVSFGDDVEEKWGTEHRMVNSKLAGGALLDLGVYALIWVTQMLYRLQGAAREEPSVTSFMTKYVATGVDESTSVLLNFPKAGAHGVALTSIRVSTDPGEKGVSGPAVRIQGTKGEIQISHPAFRPEYFRIISADGEVEDVHRPIVNGRGMFWEADEAARCLRDGKKESEIMNSEESILVMRIMDEVRAQGVLRYPDALESLDC